MIIFFLFYFYYIFYMKYINVPSYFVLLHYVLRKLKQLSCSCIALKAGIQK